MAANYLTINTQFNPYSLEEMLIPYQLYAEEYRRREDLQNQYSDTAESLGAYLDETRDAQAYGIYKAYSDALSNAANDLSTNGLSAANRKSLQDLRRRFNKEIVPISTAIQARQKYIEDFNDKMGKDSTLLSSLNPSATSIDMFLNGNTPERLDVSGALLYERMKEQANAASQRLNYDPRYIRAMNDQYWGIVQRKGFNSQDAQNFLSNMMSIPELGAMVNSVMVSSGAMNLPEIERQKALRYAIEGTLAGMVGDQDIDYRENKAWDILADLGGYELPEQENPRLLSPTELGVGRNPKNKEYNKFQDRLNGAKNLVEVNYNGESRLAPLDIIEKINFLNNEEYEYWDPVNNKPTDSKFISKGIGYSSALPHNGEPVTYQKSVPALSKKDIQKQIENYFEKEEPTYSQYADYADDLATAARLGVAVEKPEQEYSDNVYLISGQGLAGDTDLDHLKSMIMDQAAFSGLYKYDIRSGNIEGKNMYEKMKDTDPADIHLAQNSKHGDIVLKIGKDTYTIRGNDMYRRNKTLIKNILANLDNFSKENREVSIGDEKITVPGIRDKKDSPRYIQPYYNKYEIARDLFRNHSDELYSFNVDGRDYYATDFRDEDGTPYRMVLSDNGNFLYMTSAKDRAAGGTQEGFIRDELAAQQLEYLLGVNLAKYKESE